jgi:hypothetical protein
MRPHTLLHRGPEGKRKVGDASPTFGVCLDSFSHPLLPSGLGTLDLFLVRVSCVVK